MTTESTCTITRHSADALPEDRDPVTVEWPAYEFGIPMTLRLVEGAGIEFAEGGPTDEGYSASRVSYRLERQREGTRLALICEDYTEGRDCDGAHSHYARYWLPVAEDGTYPTRDAGVPAWSRGESQEWDQYAELAG